MIILASASETRAKILKEAKIKFVQKSCDFDEDSLPYKKPEHFVYHAAIGKMRACEEKFGLDTPLLTADTVVESGGEILRKAKDREDAKRILLLQSGKEVSILTCTVYKSKKLSFIDLSATVYFFDPFDKDDLKRYLDSNEWMGKAGACMVEGFCKKYIREVRGFESCARGLTIERLIPFLD